MKNLIKLEALNVLVEKFPWDLSLKSDIDLTIDYPLED